MKKVFILNHGLASGGTDSFCINILRNIDRTQFDVNVALAVDPDSAPQFREQEAIDLGVPIYKIGDLDGIKKKLLFAVRLFKLLREEKPDVFHANMDLFNGINMLVAFAAGVPTRVCHSHTTQSQYESNTGKHTIVSVYRAIMRFLLWNFSNQRCGCSDMAMDYLFRDKWKKDTHSKVVINGIDLEQFDIPVNRAKKLDSLGISSEQKNLVTVGRIAESKNPFFTVEVMDALCKICENMELIWVGEGELKESVATKLAQKNLSSKVHLLGARKDIPEILRCCDLFVFPSIFEGLPIALLEAQAAGIPCIVSNTVPKQADMGGCTFLPIDRGVDVWVEGIKAILDSPERIVDYNKIQQFDVKYMTKKLEEIYLNNE